LVTDLSQVLGTDLGHRDELAKAWDMVTLDIASVVGLFPHWEAGT
jgi:hypothetical protein